MFEVIIRGPDGREWCVGRAVSMVRVPELLIEAGEHLDRDATNRALERKFDESPE